MGTIHDPRYAAVIETLVALRKERGLTQTSLAAKLGTFKQPDIAKVEGLQRRLDLIELVDWLGALGVADVTFPNIGSFSTAAGGSPSAPSLGSEFVQLPGSAREVPGGVAVVLVNRDVQHSVVFGGTTLEDYAEVEVEVARLIRSLNEPRPALKNRNAVARALDVAVRDLPDVNPSDLYRHLVYRHYVREFKKAQASQSWVRAGGEGLELFIEGWYRNRLAAEGIEIRALLGTRAKEEALEEMGIADRVGNSELDLVLYGLLDDRRMIFGGIHSKASLAERPAGDVPCSRAMMGEGYLSVLWTFDAKDDPPRNLINRGELGTPDSPTTKRELVERDRAFDAAFVYNTRATPSEPGTEHPILVSSLKPGDDPLPPYIARRWREFRAGLTPGEKGAPPPTPLGL